MRVGMTNLGFKKNYEFKGSEANRRRVVGSYVEMLRNDRHLEYGKDFQLYTNPLLQAHYILTEDTLTTLKDKKIMKEAELNEYLESTVTDPINVDEEVKEDTTHQ